MNSGQTTIKDIAKVLNLSPSTVSRALKNHPDISEKTIKLVQETAKKLDYQPNTIALSLKNNRSYTLGVITPKLVHHFFSTVISGIEDVASKAGYHLIISQSDEKYAKEFKSVQMMMAHRVDGLFVSLASETQDLAHFENLMHKKIPLIFFDRKPNDFEVDSIIIDDYQGAYEAVEHLIKMGCKNIVHLAGPRGLLISQNRLKGFEDALDKYKLEKKFVIPCDNRIDAFQVVSDLITRQEKFDAIFAVNDDTAVGAMIALKQNDFKIPEDVAVVGFGDDPISTVVEPNLTSVIQPGYEMGKLAGQLFIEKINNPNSDTEPQQKVLNTKLIIRNSSNKI